MTDARFPERWLNDRRITRLSDAGFRLHVIGITWSVSNRTDGVIHDDELTLLPAVDIGAVGELHKAGLWQHEADRWTIAAFAQTQTTAAQLEGLEHKREVDRERQARHRRKQSQRDVTRDVARDGTRDTKDRTGQARTGSTTSDEIRERAALLLRQCDRCDSTDTQIMTDGARRCRTHAGPQWRESA